MAQFKGVKETIKMAEASECIFCKIIRGGESCRKLYEDETTLGILDIAQVTLDTGEFIPGRALIIPKRHVPSYYDLEDEEAGRLFAAAKNLAKVIKRAFNPEFVTVFIRGRGVPSHAHIILQPTVENDPIDTYFFQHIRDNFKLAPSEVLDNMAQRIQEARGVLT